MTRQRQVRQRVLACPNCGTKTYIWRKASKLRERGHKKRMWCPTCGKERNFVEMRGE